MDSRQKATPLNSAQVLLLLPRKLEQFILREQAEDLLQSPNVVAIDPPRIPYGAVARFGNLAMELVANMQAKRMKFSAPIRAVVVFHPLQYPLARSLLAAQPNCELWYSRWDRYEEAYGTNKRMRAKLKTLHDLTADKADLIFCASDALADLERDGNSNVVTVGLAADSFPSLEEKRITAVSLGHLGRRTDWQLLAAITQAMPDLTLLLVGEDHHEECHDNPHYQACKAANNIVWLGRQGDDQAARIIALADVGILPFERSKFNDTGLPYRILKSARNGRKTIVPPLRGVKTWSQAIVVADTVEEWISALRASQSAENSSELRPWAAEQTVAKVNAPLHQRIANL